MKKRYRIILLILIMMFTITGCDKRTENIHSSEMNEDDAQFVGDLEGVGENLSLMQKVLLDKEAFNDGQMISDIEGLYYNEYDTETSFIIVDLDHDGLEEVCIYYASGAVLILHEEDGEVYGYDWGFKTFHPVYTNGVFEGSSGASYHTYYGNVDFAGVEFSYDVIAARMWDNVDVNLVHYYKAGEANTEGSVEITEAEFNGIMSQYTLEKVTEYKFTIENILEYVK